MKFKLPYLRTKNHPSKTKNQGFTLVESLIALLIIGITLGGLLGSYGQNTRYLIYAKEKALSQLLLNNILIEKKSKKLTTGRDKGDMDFGYQTWYWQLVVVEFLPRNNEIKMLEAELKLFSSKADRDDKKPIQSQKFYVQK